MMMTVVLIYAMCWLPLHTVTLLGDMHQGIYDYKYIQVVWCACHWLAMSNSCYNPMVYCWMNSKYRNGFRYVLRFCPCIQYKEEHHKPSHVKRANTYISTVRSSIKDKKSSVGLQPQLMQTYDSPSPMISDGPGGRENIPLNNLANGMNKGRWGSRQYARNGESVYGRGSDLGGAEREPLTCTMDVEDTWVCWMSLEYFCKHMIPRMIISMA